MTSWPVFAFQRAAVIVRAGIGRLVADQQQGAAGLAAVVMVDVVDHAGAGRERGSSLAVLLQELRDRLHGLAGAPAALEGEAHEVHPDETRTLLHGVAREDGLVPDGDPALVHAVLEAPHPPGRVAEHAQRVVHLGDLHVRAAHARAGRVERLGELEERLALARLAVAVLGEERGPARGLGADGDEGVAHMRP